MNGDCRKVSHSLTCLAMIFVPKFMTFEAQPNPLCCAAGVNRSSRDQVSEPRDHWKEPLCPWTLWRLAGDCQESSRWKDRQSWIAGKDRGGRTGLDEGGLQGGAAIGIKSCDWNWRLPVRIIGRKLIELAFRICACVSAYHYSYFSVLTMMEYGAARRCIRCCCAIK